MKPRNSIPNDLVLLDSVDLLQDEDIIYILSSQVDWYEANGFLMVSFKQLESGGVNALKTNPEDVGVNVKKDKIVRIDNCLKRLDEFGFYHA